MSRANLDKGFLAALQKGFPQDFLTLIDAQKNLKELELTYFRALTEIQKGLTELEEITGKTF